MDQSAARAPVSRRRSFIFCPGIRPEMYPKALATGADMVCIDLEDATAPQHKERARAAAMALFAESRETPGVEPLVRINATRTPEGMADIQAMLEARAAVPALLLPKVKSPAEVTNVSDLLDEFRMPARLHVIIETNEGLEAAWDLAHASPRVEALFFGGVDMAADLRCRGTWNALLYARSRVVHAAAGAGIDAIDVPFLDLQDHDGLRAEADAAAELGFTGKGAIHPAQIPILNEVFSPSPAEIAYAERILQAFKEADTGLVVVDGKLIEKPVLRSAARTLERSGRAA